MADDNNKDNNNEKQNQQEEEEEEEQQQQQQSAPTTTQQLNTGDTETDEIVIADGRAAPTAPAAAAAAAETTSNSAANTNNADVAGSSKSCSEPGVQHEMHVVSKEFDLEREEQVDEQKDPQDRSSNKDEFGTQRVYKKTSPNCVLTLYLPTREIILTGNSPSVLRGIVFVDPKAIQGYRVYAQLTLTFRYGREDEEVMGLRFCNEAIMSLHQIWPRNEEPPRESLSPLQEALMKRLGDGTHPFTLSLTSQAPPSVQLVPAKRYYGAPIGTSYDVRCFIDEKFHRRASVKMGVRVIYRTDVYQHINGPENFAALVNSNQTQSPPVSAKSPLPAVSAGNDAHNGPSTSAAAAAAAAAAAGEQPQPSTSKGATRKSERGDSFPKLRLSPKSFRFSGRFGRSKSEIEKCPTDPFHNYSKSFQEPCDGVPGCGNIIAAGSGGIVGACGTGGGPQGAVDKPFLLQDGRVGLRASLDKSWYTHGEEVNVTVNIRNDSRKTVRKVRVCAIQHVDVCMFNNGKFKNVVADSDSSSPMDRTVPPGSTLNTTVTLRPQRGPTKNWIALEDTLQRSTEPEEITGAIAASAIRSPNMALQASGLLSGGHHHCPSPAVALTQAHGSSDRAGAGTASGNNAANGGSVDDRNVFAIYVSYYVKVKLTLSGMGGELSLKLPFVLVHVDDCQRPGFIGPLPAGEHDARMERLALHDVPALRKNGKKSKLLSYAAHNDMQPSTSAAAAAAAAAVADAAGTSSTADHIEIVDESSLNLSVPTPMTLAAAAAAAAAVNGTHKRRLQRSETIAKDLDEVEEDVEELEQHAVAVENGALNSSSVHVVQVHQIEPQPNVQLNNDERGDDDVAAAAAATAAGANVAAAAAAAPAESTAPAEQHKSSNV